MFYAGIARTTYLEAQFLIIDLWIEMFEIGIGWNYALLQHEHCFDDSG